MDQHNKLKCGHPTSHTFISGATRVSPPSVIPLCRFGRFLCPHWFML